MPNQLASEVSPYLLQHADNPVNWYPWGEEALKRAREEDKPIFLSIGYAACHWCHVMAHESFEDEETARILNEHFVSIKVDREERPDLDTIYMNAVVAMTGQGGWPMSVFLTPSGEPFYGGTYFPPRRRQGMPAFIDVLNSIIAVWSGDRSEIYSVSARLTQHLRDSIQWVGLQAPEEINRTVLDRATTSILASYDMQNGGWGKAPKFPQPMTIEFLLAQSVRGFENALSTASHALEAMSRGGMYDVVGGGFHRYSTDRKWLVPHFEKMLYDNAQLALAYLHASLLTGSENERIVCTETLDFLIREMRLPGGGFISSLDADINGQEGLTYLWTPAELREAIGSEEDFEFFTRIYPLTPSGDFEGRNILQRDQTWEAKVEELEMVVDELRRRVLKIKARLLDYRSRRPQPGRDDKVLVSWNALTLRAFAEAAMYLRRPDYLQIARDNARFLLSELYRDGRLLRSWREGQARHDAYLEDYAALIIGLISLYQADMDPAWFQAALKLANEILAGFSDPAGGFFDTRDNTQLVLRPKETQDNATPSGNAMAAYALLLLSLLDESRNWREIVEPMLATVTDLVLRYPTAFSFWLQAMDLAIGPTYQIALILPEDETSGTPLIDHILKTYRPGTVFVRSKFPPLEGSPGLLADRPLLNDQPTVYLCQAFTCLRPTNDLSQLQLDLP